METRTYWRCLAVIVCAEAITMGNGPTLGQNGVNATNLGLTGTSINIGQVPAGAQSIDDAIAVSESPDSTIEHIFFLIPETGDYELWVYQFDNDVGIPNYGLTWWGVSAAGDFNSDSSWDCQDVNALSHAIATSSTNLTFDLNGDGFVNLLDITDQASGWLTIAGAINTAETSGLPFLHGDGNLSGAVDGSDFGIWISNVFTFNDKYCEGDFNADGAVDGGDFGVWNSHSFYSSSTVPMVPEPMSSLLLMQMAVVLAVGRRPREGRMG